MTLKGTYIELQTVPEADSRTHGPQLIFLHANGYPPESYRLLLDALAREFCVRAIELRPLWHSSAPASIDSWHELSRDFLSWLRHHADAPIAAVGHSMGAIVALRAALQEPSRFLALVLVDPVIVLPKQILEWRRVRHAGQGYPLHYAIRRAEKRRSVFENMNEAFEAYRRHAIFRHLGDEELRQAIRGMMQTTDGHLALRYSPAWEAHLYFTAMWNDGDLWAGLPSLSVPTLIVRGSESDTLSEGVCAAVQAANRRIQVETIEQATHLVPLERPAEVCAVTSKFLQHSLVAAGSETSAVL